MNGWSAKEVVLSPAPSYSGVVTDQLLSLDGWPVTAGGSLNMVVKIKVSAATAVGTITAKLQTAEGNDWQDSKTVSITGAGVFYIKLQTSVTLDQPYLPLLNKGRVVVSTTNAGDSVSVSSVAILQEL
jgi:hypothetical protein